MYDFPVEGMMIGHARGLAILVLALAGSPALAQQRPTTLVAEGRIAGVREGGLNIYRGIPYARPPVGPLRWRPPVAPERWTGSRDATAFGPSCVQPLLPATSLSADN